MKYDAWEIYSFRKYVWEWFEDNPGRYETDELPSVRNNIILDEVRQERAAYIAMGPRKKSNP